jgi:site-specific DNA recombinase
MKKVADLYIRVSTDEQANSGYSQRHQEEMLRKYCEINAIQVRNVIFEDHSAKSFERPEWKKMLAEYRKHKGLIDCILFLKWDRFSRNAGDSYAMIATLNKLGIEPQAIEQPLDLSIPENKMMLAFYLAAPEVENARRALNVTHGMRRARKEGRHMGVAPIGYSNKVYETGRKYIAPKQPEADIIRWAFEQLATGTVSVLELWQQAKAKGLGCCKNNFWHLIQNPIYCGKVLVPQYQQEESYLVQGTHEPIISEELFYTAQDVLHGRKKPVTTKQAVREEFPLRNFLTCPKCGRLITASRSKGRTNYYNYYHCTSACGWRYKAEYINETFIQELRKYKPTLAMLSIYKEVILDVYNSQQAGMQGEKRMLMQQINEQNNRMTKARELLLAEAIDTADYKAIKTECERKLHLLEAKLSSTSPKQENIERLLDKALYNLAYIDERFANGDIKEKRSIIGSIYPEKLQFENNAYRTARVNEAVIMICTLEAVLKGHKKGQTSDVASLSKEVIRIGFEPMTLSLEG